MRILELLIVVGLLGYIVHLLSPHRSDCLWFSIIPLLCFAVVAFQLAIEGYRWQMLPVYAVLCASIVFEAVPGLIVDVQAQYVAGLFALCCVGLGITLSTVFPVFQLPPPTGPYAVGSQIRHLVDRNRRETADPDSLRELMVQVWYPAKTPASGKLAPYRDSATTTIKDARFSLVTTHSVVGAPLAAVQKRYPVLLYSPSWSGMRTENTLLAEELASRGYIVVGIDYPYSSLATAFPDGRVIRTKLFDEDFYSSDAAFSAFLKTAEMQIEARADDTRFVLDALRDIDAADPTSLFSGRLDLDHTGIFGFSLGGGVAAQTCWLDPRLKACVSMDGFMAGESMRQGAKAPLLIIDEANPSPPYSIPKVSPSKFRELASDWEQFSQMRRVFSTYGGYWVAIPRAKHFNFSDYAFSSPLRFYNLSGKIIPASAARIISQYTLAFFDKYLKGIDQPLLDERSEHTAEVRFERSEAIPIQRR